MSHSVTERQFILISGIPGSGKTLFGNYFSKEHGFCFFNTDSNWAKFETELRLGVDDFVARWLKSYDHVCLEWGFIPCYLPIVLSFKKQGASIFWFTCDKDIARLNYLKAHTKDDPEGLLMKIQLERIKAAGLPTSDFVIIETYHDGNSIPVEELAPKILSKSGNILPRAQESP